MGMAPSHRRVRFGSFEMDEIAGELCKDGAKIRLQEQPFQILQILLKNPGEELTISDGAGRSTIHKSASHHYSNRQDASKMKGIFRKQPDIGTSQPPDQTQS